MSDFAVAIYEPPRLGWPFVVMVRRGGECQTFVADTRTEAREIALSFRSSKCQAVLVDAGADG